MKRVAFLLIAITCLGFQPVVTAEELAPLYPGFPPIRESKAYKKFSTRTYSEFSKILYLIDRYSDSQILINYEDQNYNAAFSTTVARWFLSRNYKKQTAKEWVIQWCSKSILASKPIFVKLPNEKFVLAREVLEAELADLERVIRENQIQTAPSLAPETILTAPVSEPAPKQTAVPTVSAAANAPSSSILKSTPALAVASAESPASKA